MFLPTFRKLVIDMIYTHKQCLKEKGSSYMIQKAVMDGELYQIEKGVYADTHDVSTLAILSTKHPEAIITLDTAFYYHGLTDVIPDEYYLATPKHARKLRDPRIKQVYVPDNIFSLGMIVMYRRDAAFKIYDKERMLIELLSRKNSLPYDYYKEILGNYRSQIHELDIERIQNYAESFPKHKMISAALLSEVF